jgi:GNAT superfamily N-acetyltransferase
MIRAARHQDADGFHALARAYIAESGQHREYSIRQTQAAFERVLDDPAALMLIADGDEGTTGYAIAGGVIAQLDHAFTADPVCLLPMFYIAGPYRGTGLARALLHGACTWADDCGCSHTFASATGELPGEATAQFENLCAKFQFQRIGSPVLARRKS